MKTTIVSLMLVAVFILPAMAATVYIEVGTYYDNLSIVTPYGDGDDSRAIVVGQVPSGTIDLGTGAASFYIMYFLGKHFTFGLETNMGIFSVFDESSDGDGNGPIFSLGSLGLAARTTYYFRNNSGNSPYLLGRIARTSLSGSDFSFYNDDYDIISLGTGIGYQYHIRPGFVLRTELRYHRMFATPERDFSHAFPLVIGLGIK